jgi:ubiquitin-like protein Pup
MAKQTKQEKTARKKEEAPVESKKSQSAEETIKKTDKMLDKIDDLLKDIKAEEFVRGYVQKGGE